MTDVPGGSSGLLVKWPAGEDLQRQGLRQPCVQIRRRSGQADEGYLQTSSDRSGAVEREAGDREYVRSGRAFASGAPAKARETNTTNRMT
jgi:hypothetical protein